VKKWKHNGNMETGTEFCITKMQMKSFGGNGNENGIEFSDETDA
jgi:hypothetical protein